MVGIQKLKNFCLLPLQFYHENKITSYITNQAYAYCLPPNFKKFLKALELFESPSSQNQCRFDQA